MREFKTIRFYPKKSSYEFFNIGLYILGSDEPMFRLIDEEGIKTLSRLPYIDEKILRNAIDNIKNVFVSEKADYNSLIDNYRNTVDTSNTYFDLSDKPLLDRLNKLYYDLVTYKFDSRKKTKDLKDKLHEYVCKTIKIAEQEFNNYVVVKQPKAKFDLTIFAKSKKELHHCLVGSSNNKQELARPMLLVPLVKYKRIQYNFLDTKTHNNNDHENPIRALDLLGYSYNHYANDDDIFNFLYSVK